MHPYLAPTALSTVRLESYPMSVDELGSVSVCSVFAMNGDATRLAIFPVSDERERVHLLSQQFCPQPTIETLDWQFVLQVFDDLPSYGSPGIEPPMRGRVPRSPSHPATIGDVGSRVLETGAVHPKHSGPNSYEFVSKVAKEAGESPQSCAVVRDDAGTILPILSWRGRLSPPGQTSVEPFGREEKHGGYRARLVSFRQVGLGNGCVCDAWLWSS